MEQNLNTPVFSKRTLIGTVIISLGVIVLLGAVMIGSFTPCIANYYDLMIVYPDATPVSETKDIVNYFGFGKITNSYFVAEDPSVVRKWYKDTIDEAKRVRRDDLMAHAGDIPPWWQGDYQGIPLWEGSYTVSPTDGGSKIILSANCY